jgi:23S rRNA (cytosine1962-C5)-methyltransferase
MLVQGDLPRPGGRAVAVRIVPAAERALRAGHPWLFASSIRDVGGDPKPGDPAVVFDRKNRFLAAGLWDPEGPIRVRVLVHERPAPIGPELFALRIREALDRRPLLLADPSTTGLRLVHGEGDGFPGLVVDRYGDRLVAKIYSAAWIPHLDAIADALEAIVAPEGILLLPSRRIQGSDFAVGAVREPVLLRGRLPEAGAREAPGTLPFLEHELRFEAHPLQGHKTGFYLDQRDNRAAVETWTGGARVLNAFSYTGGFSLAAARGGASEVTSLDVSAPALAQARRHFDLNAGVPAVTEARHETLEADAFDAMQGMARARRRFDVIVVDPPSFAKEAKQAAAALAQYGRLTVLALALLEPGGLLVQASCSSRVSAEDFFQRIHEAARGAGRPLVESARTGHPEDHPARWPEGAYLKALWARAP